MKKLLIILGLIFSVSVLGQNKFSGIGISYINNSFDSGFTLNSFASNISLSLGVDGIWAEEKVILDVGYLYNINEKVRLGPVIGVYNLYNKFNEINLDKKFTIGSQFLYNIIKLNDEDYLHISTKITNNYFSLGLIIGFK